MTPPDVDEKRLEDLVERAVQKHLDLTFQDMEKVRPSPAAAIIRIEGRLDVIETRLERDMVTRAEFKDEIWKVRLYIILLGVLVVLTNPKVLELLGKLLSIFKP